MLKTILVQSSTKVEYDSMASAGDILNFLTLTITTVPASDVKKISYLRVCLNVLSRLYSIPEAKEVTEGIVR